jgi:GTP-binding protein
MKIKEANFIISNTDVDKCPKDGKTEFAFIGRSNVGKSSLINMLTDRKNLAKTSGKPGKTQLINHFLINDEWYLVDLPGYGWAKVSKTKRSEFGDIITAYLSKRPTLACTFILIDSRLPPQPIDINFINWIGEAGLAFCLVFTKADKMTLNKLNASVEAFKRELLNTWEELPPYVVTSSVNKDGKDELLGFIGEVLKTDAGN